MCVCVCVCVCVQSVMPSSQDDSVKDKPRPLSSISRQQRSKTHITRTASGNTHSHTQTHTHTQSHTHLAAAEQCTHTRHDTVEHVSRQAKSYCTTLRPQMLHQTRLLRLPDSLWRAHDSPEEAPSTHRLVRRLHTANWQASV